MALVHLRAAVQQMSATLHDARWLLAPWHGWSRSWLLPWWTIIPTQAGPAGAFAQKHTVLHNVLSDNSLHGHITVSRCRGSSSYRLLRGSFEL